jgi:hypothetical protein
MMDPSADPAVLLTVVTTSEEGSHKINIYGTPGRRKGDGGQFVI